LHGKTMFENGWHFGTGSCPSRRGDNDWLRLTGDDQRRV
jgi:hypothetical protein